MFSKDDISVYIFSKYIIKLCIFILKIYNYNETRIISMAFSDAGYGHLDTDTIAV